jgi:hypothetical protein
MGWEVKRGVARDASQRKAALANRFAITFARRAPKGQEAEGKQSARGSCF